MAIAKGEGTITDSVAVARGALEKASLLQRKTEKEFIKAAHISNPNRPFIIVGLNHYCEPYLQKARIKLTRL